MRGKVYLYKRMLRRLLTCLALLTGLAAVGAPAHANIAEALGTTLELAQKSDESSRSEKCPCEEQQRMQRARGDKVAKCKPAAPISIFIPTVQFGADRAFE